MYQLWHSRDTSTPTIFFDHSLTSHWHRRSWKNPHFGSTTRASLFVSSLGIIPTITKRECNYISQFDSALFKIYKSSRMPQANFYCIQEVYQLWMSSAYLHKLERVETRRSQTSYRWPHQREYARSDSRTSLSHVLSEIDQAPTFWLRPLQAKKLTYLQKSVADTNGRNSLLE